MTGHDMGRSPTWVIVAVLAGGEGFSEPWTLPGPGGETWFGPEEGGFCSDCFPDSTMLTEPGAV